MSRPTDRHSLGTSIGLPLIDVVKATTSRQHFYHGQLAALNLLVALLAISGGRQLNDLCRRGFADTERQHALRWARVQLVASIQEGLGNAGRQGIKACECLFDSGIEAGRIDGDVVFEIRN